MAVDSSVFEPAMYAVVIEQVIVIVPEVSFKRVIRSPSANVASGIVILPPVVRDTYCPTSPTSRV